MADAKVKSKIKLWSEFVKRQKNKEFVLNANKKVVEGLAKGVLHNESTKGLGFCPCRLSTGDKVKDIKLICPCNFKSQETWKEKGECWCSLFIKRKSR